MNKRWKQAERRAAKLFGTCRTPLSGSNGKVTASDTFHPSLYLEIKQRLSHGVFGWMLEARKLAKAEGKTPIVVLDQVRSPGQIVCVHSQDLDQFCQEWLRQRGLL